MDISASLLSFFTSQHTDLTTFHMLMLHLVFVVPKLKSMGKTSIIVLGKTF